MMLAETMVADLAGLWVKMLAGQMAERKADCSVETMAACWAVLRVGSVDYSAVKTAVLSDSSDCSLAERRAEKKEKRLADWKVDMLVKEWAGLSGLTSASRSAAESVALSVMLLVDRMAELMELNLVEPKAVRMAAWVVMLAVRLAAMSDSWADRWVLPWGLCLAVMLVDLMVVRSAEKWVVAMAYSLVAMSAVSLVVYLVAKRGPPLVVEMVFPTAERWAAWSVS
jgi:hypothetical protein